MDDKSDEQSQVPAGHARPWWKRAARWVQGSAILVLLKLTSRLPAPVVYRLGRALGWLLYYLSPEKRRRADQSLSLVLGDELTAAQRRRMIRRMMIHYACGAMEALYALRLSPGQLRDLVPIQGEQHLQDALARGRGVIALGIHLGPFPVIGARLRAEGYPYHLVIRGASDSRLEAYLSRLRAKWGITAYYRRWDIRHLPYALRRGAILHLFIDQYAAVGGIRAQLLGHPTQARCRPARLCLQDSPAPLSCRSS